MSEEPQVHLPLRLCAGCFQWLPLVRLTEHRFTRGTKREGQRTTRWFYCRECQEKYGGQTV